MSLLKKLDEIRERCEKATKGAWYSHTGAVSCSEWHSFKGIYQDDVDFIVHARQDLPELEQALREAHGLILQSVELEDRFDACSTQSDTEAWCEDFAHYKQKRNNWMEKYDGPDTTDQPTEKEES